MSKPYADDTYMYKPSINKRTRYLFFHFVSGFHTVRHKFVRISTLRPGPVFCLLLRVSSDCAQPITGQVTEVTCPVIGQAQPELTPNKRQKTGPGPQPFWCCTLEYFGKTKTKPWVQITWILASPGHQQPCKWLLTDKQVLVFQEKGCQLPVLPQCLEINGNTNLFYAL